MSITLAEKLFRSFFGREPEKKEIVQVSTKGAVDALVVGKLVGVIYQSEIDKRPFIHRFKKSNRPYLLVSDDGKQIYTLKGAYRFTERGFEG